MAGTAPSWDLKTMPGIAAPAAADRVDALQSELMELAELYQKYGIGSGGPLPTGAGLTEVFDLLLTRTSAALHEERLLSLAHAGWCWSGGEQRDAASVALLEIQQRLAPVTALQARLKAWAARLPLDWMITNSGIAAAHHRWLQQCHAGRWLPAGEEDLLAQLDKGAGATAWRRLYEDAAARAIQSPDQSPAALPRLDQDTPDAVAAWTGMTPIAVASLNAILAQEWIVAQRRGWNSLLDQRLHPEGLTAPTLETALCAASSVLEELRRFAVAKARRLEMPSLPYEAIGATLPDEPRWTWDAAAALVIQAFQDADPEFGELAVTAVQQGWIDAASRPGKRPIGLCLPLHDGQARVMVTFDGSAESVLRLAHELGHAFHHIRQNGQSEWQRESPLMLREMAGMVAEQTVVLSGGTTPAEQSALRGAWLSRTFRTCVLGLSRWRFEQEVTEQRKAGPLTEADFDAAARRSQQLVHAAGVTRGTVPRDVWISHPHLYTGRFNSLSYILARIATAAAFPGSAPPGLPQFLTGTGLRSPADLFTRHGHDLDSPDFWDRGVLHIKAHVDQFSAGLPPDPRPLAESAGGSR